MRHNNKADHETIEDRLRDGPHGGPRMRTPTATHHTGKNQFSGGGTPNLRATVKGTGWDCSKRETTPLAEYH